MIYQPSLYRLATASNRHFLQVCKPDDLISRTRIGQHTLTPASCSSRVREIGCNDKGLPRVGVSLRDAGGEKLVMNSAT